MTKNVFSLYRRQYDPNYKFHKLDSKPTDLYLENDEGITFDKFDSISQGWWLVDRKAPTPSEKAITVDIPYKQGEDDYSVFNAQRYYHNREITYQFIIADDDYRYRDGKANEAVRLLTYNAKKNLHDTAIPGFYFKNAKCVSTEVEDDAEDGTVTLTAKFEAYPYAIEAHADGADKSDIWDDVVFDNYIWQNTMVDTDNTKYLHIVNWGSRPVYATVHCQGSMTITNNVDDPDASFDMKDGEEKKLLMKVGTNDIMVNGNGSLWFEFRVEVMV